MGIHVMALRSGKGVLQDGLEGVEATTELSEFKAWQPEAVLVCTPTSRHAEPISMIRDLKIPILVEKPLVALGQELIAFEGIEDRIQVAYCLRFHPIVTKLKEVLEGQNVDFVRFQRSHYLPNWHPYADYRTEYMGRKDLGGGVVRTLSHELDLAGFLFGPTKLEGAQTAKLSDLEIDVEDWALIHLTAQNAKRVEIELDYFSPSPINIASFTGNFGIITYDMVEGILEMESRDGERTTLYQGDSSDIDQMYREQLKDFLGFCEGRQGLQCNYEQGVHSVKLIGAILKS